MYTQYRTFIHALLIILLSTAVVTILYTYTVNTSLTTVKEEIQTNNLNRLRILVNNLENSVEQLSLLSIALDTDSKMKLLSSIDVMSNYDRDRLIQDLIEKTNLQSFTQGWKNQLSVYSPLLNMWISSHISQNGLPPTNMKLNQWWFDPSDKQFTFIRESESYAVQVTFPIANLQQMLNSAKVESNNPFFYHPDYSIITGTSSETDGAEEILKKFSPLKQNEREGTKKISIGKDEYMVNYIQSEPLGWYLIDFVPLDQALQPIVKTQQFFYAACVMLILAGAIYAVFLYRKVQIPIITLLRGVRQLKNGSFSHRIKNSSRNEFDILYQNFNDMAEQIEELIEKVYKEKIVSREALVKQLQAQINPHFLYNSLFFINNMNRLGNDEAITAMTENLAEYFRYTTRLNDPLTTLQKELGVVQNYLNIQCLRMNRLRYEIHIPESMNQLMVPKLLIQPLVENSVIHGIECEENAGLVRIEGVESEHQYRLFVEDDGIGMSDEEIQALLHQIKQPLSETMGCALWNIRQRMDIHFKNPAGLEIERSTYGGLRIELFWPKEDPTGGNVRDAG